jgi:hypothetical protein
MRAKSLIFPVLLTLIEKGVGEGGWKKWRERDSVVTNQEPRNHTRKAWETSERLKSEGTTEGQQLNFR